MSLFNLTRQSLHDSLVRKAWWAYNEDTHQHDLAGYVKRGGNLRLVLVREVHPLP